MKIVIQLDIDRLYLHDKYSRMYMYVHCMYSVHFYDCHLSWILFLLGHGRSEKTTSNG